MIRIIACIGKNGELGFKGNLLFRIPDDLKRFRRLTEGGRVVMGRKTFESLGRPLPNRENIVLSRRGVRPEDVQGDFWVIGGAQIYSYYLSRADELYLTEVDAEAEADVYFPEIEGDWDVAEEGPFEHGPLRYRYRTYKRKKNLE